MILKDNMIMNKLLEKYEDVFSEQRVTMLSSTEMVSHHIQLVKKVQSLYESLYNLLTSELDVLRKYLKNMQQQQ